MFGELRAACAAVAGRARHVGIDDAALRRLAETLRADLGRPLPADPAHHRLGSDAGTLAFVITLDAVNFGSGWFPLLRKRDGRSGYFTIAAALRAHFEREGPWTAADLAALDASACAQIFDQEGAPREVLELMAHFARSLGDLGRFLRSRFDGRFEGLVESAGGRAGRLVEILAEMPCYRDVARYDELQIPFYKRAQITVADLALVFEGEGPGRFADVDDLTIFADNLVPHVLRCEGVLLYEPALATRVDADQPIASGSREEVEIRAVALHAVERMVAALGAGSSSSAPASARSLDEILWHRGQSQCIKSRPRHRTRCVFY